MESGETITRACIRCLVHLIIPETWRDSLARHRDYRCKACFEKENQVHIEAYRRKHPDRIQTGLQNWRDSNPAAYAAQKERYKVRRKNKTNDE